ncbi:MAG: PD-(D/E)XK nuclease family protein [Microscillaceae bacterium]|nr:PD-(D/E)XK nuclease family protein [Microscillaceae bacterium]MDW8460354.1 PD-(D/E)XK nuclease family protein [Cytophagales bacterium]
MKPFLLLTAQHIIATNEAKKLEKSCIILPTRRACFELMRVFKELKLNHLPYITHIEQFISEIYYRNPQGRPTNPIILLLEMYDIFHELAPETSLERFTSWGYILLHDFDQIDRHLIHAETLFENLYDIKNIERWSPDRQPTESIDRYFKLWENLATTYQKFKALLTQQGQSYMGMMYRALAENVEHYFLEKSQYEHYFFVGFNYLSKAEEHFISKLIKYQKATFLTDADTYYMEYSQENKAGIFLKKYKKTWLKDKFDKFLFQTDYLLTQPKQIETISVSNASLQGKVANQLLSDWQVLEKNTPTVIVLADENILLPLIHAIHPQYEGMNITMGLPLKNSALFTFVDILFEQHTLRYTLKNEQGESETKFSYRTVTKLLNHPFVRQFERKQKAKIAQKAELNQENLPPVETENTANTNETQQRSIIQNIIYHINKHNRIYLSQAEILEILAQETLALQNLTKTPENTELSPELQAELTPYQNLLKALFEHWKSPLAAIENFELLMQLLNPQENVFEARYFEQFMEIISNLKTFLQSRRRSFSMRTFRIFLYQAFREATVPLDNDENTILQIMGLLETRTLDFDNVIVLSVNETILPKSKKANSFIPLDIAFAYGLPTYQENDAITSYHFFRLLQRAKRVALVYVLPSDTYGGEEKSRFIHQIENDLCKANPHIQLVHKQAFIPQSSEKQPYSITIPKTSEILEKIFQKIEQGLSPSEVNMFITCSLKFYFNQIAQISEVTVADEYLSNTDFGTIIHEILEEIFRQNLNEKHEISPEKLSEILENIEFWVSQKFEEHAYKQYIMVGKNYINRQMATEYVKRFLEHQIAEMQAKNQNFQIIALENRTQKRQLRQEFVPLLSTHLQTILHGKEMRVTLKGIIDRIDRFDNQIRIVDYKTGSIDEKSLKIIHENLEQTLLQDDTANYIRQLWLYKYILAKKISQKQFPATSYLAQIAPTEVLTAGIYNLQKPEKMFLEITAKSEKKGDSQRYAFIAEDLQKYIEISEQYLTQILARLTNPQEPFIQTPNEENCVYCAYKNICLRGQS